MKNILCLLLWLTLLPGVHGQPVNPATDPPFSTTGAFFALYVTNLEASAQWYTQKLGLKVVMQVPKQNKVAVTVLEGGGLTVELIEHDDAVALKDTPPALGMFKAGVVVDDFDKTLASLSARNVPIAFGPFPAKPNQRANLIIRDNAGNLIQFFGK